MAKTSYTPCLLSQMRDKYCVYLPASSYGPQHASGASGSAHSCWLVQPTNLPVYLSLLLVDQCPIDEAASHKGLPKVIFRELSGNLHYTRIQRQSTTSSIS
jgi:hypothetical protein